MHLFLSREHVRYCSQESCQTFGCFFLGFNLLSCCFSKEDFCPALPCWSKRKGLQLLLSALRFLEKTLLPPRMAEYPYLDGTESVNLM